MMRTSSWDDLKKESLGFARASDYSFHRSSFDFSRVSLIKFEFSKANDDDDDDDDGDESGLVRMRLEAF